MKSNKSKKKLHEIAFLADFWPFLKLQKMEFGQKKFRAIDLFASHEFLWPGLFLNFLAHCGLVCDAVKN